MKKTTLKDKLVTNSEMVHMICVYEVYDTHSFVVDRMLID